MDVAIALLFNEASNEVLLVRNKKGDSSYWSLPGGAVELGESLHEAVIREAKEETGLDIEVLGLHSVREAYFIERGHHALLFTFHSKVTGGELCVDDPDQDIIEVEWVDLETANKRMPYLPMPLKAPDFLLKEQNAQYIFQGKVD
ncbi:NUDIX domain-containing protein [Bacillus horti]|uniref:NUDIX domain-containing protein n=1 Tax=Caldalkalibacillus horti TaxID=77523 RepID=UPI0027D7C041|nr:NUDIX hydrolase [Bacillus horti]